MDEIPHHSERVTTSGNWYSYMGKSVAGKLCRCDNAAVVTIIRSGTSKDNFVMELICNLCFILAHFNVLLVTEHIPGVLNGAVDALSRKNQSSFHSQVPSVHHKSQKNFCSY